MPPIYIGSNLAKLCVGAQIVSAVYIGSTLAYSSNTDPVAPTNITLSASSVSEAASVGTVVGLLGSNGYPSSTYSKILDAGSKFSVVGNELRIAAALDYETATSHSVTIRATNASGSYDKVFAVSIANTTELPVNTVAPSISGSPTQGGTLTGADGAWTSAAGAISYARQWLRGGVAISGATGAGYVLTADDVGSMIGYRVTATNSDGSTQTTSATVGPVAASIFSPAALFAAGEQGVWYDPSDMSTLYQDAEGTMPVTAVGQPVGKMLDKSGRGNHMTQPTSTSRPIYQIDENGRPYLSFDGVDDGMYTATINASLYATVSIFLALETRDGAALQVAMEFGPSSTDGTFYISLQEASNYALQSRGGIPASYVPITGYPALEKAVLSASADLGNSIRKIRRNGGLYAQSTMSATGNFLAHTLNLGRRDNVTLPAKIGFYGGIVAFYLINTGAVANVESYLAGKVGITL